MKKIVKGNDFMLKIPVMKMVEGRPQAFVYILKDKAVYNM